MIHIKITDEERDLDIDVRTNDIQDAYHVIDALYDEEVVDELDSEVDEGYDMFTSNVETDETTKTVDEIFKAMHKAMGNIDRPENRDVREALRNRETLDYSLWKYPFYRPLF